MVDGRGVALVEPDDEIDLTLGPRTGALALERSRAAGGSRRSGAARSARSGSRTATGARAASGAQARVPAARGVDTVIAGPLPSRAQARGRTSARSSARSSARTRGPGAGRGAGVAKGPVVVAFIVSLLLVGVALRVLDPPETYTLGVGLPEPAASRSTGAGTTGPATTAGGTVSATGSATLPGTASATGTGSAAPSASSRAGRPSTKPAVSGSRRPSASGSRSAAKPVPVVAGASHYVSPSGSDSGAGTSSAPWRTLERAMEALRPGDTLVVGDGTYRERLDSVKITRGTSGGPIRVQAAPGARPVLVGMLWFHDADYWNVSGLNVQWDASDGSGDHMVKFSGGSNWSFTDAEVWGARAYAAILIADGSHAFRLARLYVHDTVPTHDTNQDHLIYVNADAQGGVIEYCVLADSPNGRAVKVGPPSGSSELRGNLTIRYNTMYNNGGPSNVQVSQRTSNVKVYRNIMVKPGSGMQNVTALSLSGTGNVVSDNVIFASAGAVEPGFSGLKDGGGNIKVDPRFRDAAGGDFHTGAAAVAGYGRYAR